MSRLDPLSLKLFISVVERGTIAAAAESQHISSAAVSKRIAEMESALRTSLLYRNNKGVEPTSAGLALLQLARSAIHELDQVWAQMESFATGVRGLVRVCASMSAITQFLAEPLQSFMAMHPEVQLQLEEKTSPLVAKAVSENAADIGIYLPLVSGLDMETYPFQSDRLVVIAPKNHVLTQRKALAFKDALDYDFVGLHTGSAINILLSRAAQNIQRPFKLRIQVTSFDALCVMVNTGLGISVIPEMVAQRLRKAVQFHIIPLSDVWARREFLLAVRSMDTLPAAARLLAEHLLKTSASGA
ncbi:LysR family transcriptional regulator [Pollutimonas sp. M17]|uniref:LysR family transcriptional regulator n=1 Tax=Pollutimonas sp. M17 TaxID=2962065 RepID=UPI0021F4B5D3|nr:LysR family transcriptional regulator [Pollutimonas sp. M17]UYO94614.1 LysR family transcriptional regulator [Pollutimonas sp. M17]